MATDACTGNAATSDATGNSSPIEESAEASLQRMGPDLAAKVIRAFTQCQSQAAVETSAQDAAIKAMKDLLPNGVHDSVASKISVYLTSMWQTSDSRFTDDWGVHSITFSASKSACSNDPRFEATLERQRQEAGNSRNSYVPRRHCRW